MEEEIEQIDFEPVAYAVWGADPEGGEDRLLERHGPDELEEALESCVAAATVFDGMATVVAEGPEGQEVAVLCHDLAQFLCVGETAEVECPGVTWRHPHLDELLSRRSPRP